MENDYFETNNFPDAVHMENDILKHNYPIVLSLAQGLEIIYIWLLMNFLNIHFFLLCASL